MKERTYSSFEIMRALDIRKEKLRDWINGGFLKPSIPSAGRGKPAAFSITDIYGLGLFMELISYGLARERAAVLVSSYRDKYFMNAVVSATRVEAQGNAEAGITSLVGEHHGYADFIIFCRKTDTDGNNVIKASGVTDDKWRVSLRSGGSVSNELDPKNEPLREWDSLLIINYKKIRNAVDEALANI